LKSLKLNKVPLNEFHSLANKLAAKRLLHNEAKFLGYNNLHTRTAAK